MTKESVVFAYSTSNKRVKVVDAVDFKQSDNNITFKVRIDDEDYYILYDKSTQEFFECIPHKEKLYYVPYEPFHLKAISIERVITERWSVK